MNPLVTVITPTTGASHLSDCINSVALQSYQNIQHIVAIDGQQHGSRARTILERANQKFVDLMTLPYSTGQDRFNGHRIYGSMTYIAKGEFLCFLDEDNWFAPHHIESLITGLTKTGNLWAYSLRKIYDREGNFVCNDDCESLGFWRSCLGDFLVDVGCFFFP